MNKPIRLTKKWHYLLVTSFVCVIMIGLALAAILSWFIIIKPFDKFEHLEVDVVIGENLFEIDYYDYKLIYEVEGKSYEKQIRISSTINSNLSYGVPSIIKFDYLVSDPKYTLDDRKFALSILPLVSVILTCLSVLVIRAYKRKSREISNNKLHEF